jgi:hypothetical protein
METQGYISRPANSVMKEYLLDKFKRINDIRTNDIDDIGKEIRKFDSSKEILGDEWLTGEFKEKAPEIIAAIIVDEILMKMDGRSDEAAFKLLILIHDRLMLTQAN